MFNRDFIKEHGKWFLKEVKSDEKHELDSLSLTVKLKGNFTIENLQTLNQQSGVVIERINELGYIDLKITNKNYFNTFRKYVNSGLFEIIEPNSFGEFLDVPNDPEFPSQYNLKSYNSPYPSINAELAWDIEKGYTNPVIVASVDQGINYIGNLEFSIWSGIGYDFVDMDNSPLPNSVSHHGSYTSSAFCWKSNDGIGGASVSGGWGNDLGTKVMILKVGYKDPITYIDYVLGSVVDDAIIYAAQNGAKVINMSFRCDETQSIKDAILYANNYYGCVVVAATGNTTKPGVNFPAKYTPVIAVAGIEKTWNNYGNYGSELDIVAPSQLVPAVDNNSVVSLVTGTSIAAPQVAGVSALLLSYKPNLTHKDIENVIKNSTTYVGSSTVFGAGLINAYNALLATNSGSTNTFLPDPPPTISFTINGLLHPVISWQNVYPIGKTISKFNIYRSSSVNGRFNFVKVGEVNYNSNALSYTWTDVVTGGSGLQYYYYRITSQDLQNKESITSNEVAVNTIIQIDLDKKGENMKLNSYSLEQNFPNPFNPTTTISFAIKESGLVTLKVYDMLGKIVKTLINENREPGNYSVEFDGRNLSSGVYFYELKANNFHQINKMILNK